MSQQALKKEADIQKTKDIFEAALKSSLDLTRVSAPIAVMQGTGINDDLSGTERCVAFPVKALQDKKAVVVNSLAKWKRMRLKELNLPKDTGIVTDMRAIRPDEDFSSIHSIYVDQWDWEKTICPSSRSIKYLKQEVEKIYDALKITEDKIVQEHSEIEAVLPEQITFIHAEDLLRKYPDLTPKGRENAIAKEYGAVFLIGIGGLLSNGEPHDGRAPDYDDWSTQTEAGYAGLNGDILLWNPILEKAFEISSMGIRVDKKALLDQLKRTGKEDRKELLFHKMLLDESLPQSIGGGIGQSRMVMFMLRKRHIGEVQVGIWSEDIRKQYAAEGIHLL